MDNTQHNKRETESNQNVVTNELNKRISLKMNDQEAVVLERALQLTGVGRYSYILFVFSIYSVMSAVSEIFGVGIVATAAQCDLDLDVYKKGLIGSLPMLGVMISGHLWGYIADTKGRKFTLYITIGGTFLTATVSSLANHWIFLAFTKFVSAMFASGTNAVMYTLLGESTPQSHRAKFLLYAATGVSFSQAVMALVALPILKESFSLPTILGFNYRPWRLLAQTYGIMSGVNLLLLYLLIFESPKFYISRGKENEGIEVLIKMFVANNGMDPETYSVKHIVVDEEVASKKEQSFFKSIWAQTVPLLGKQHIKNTMLMFYTCIVVYSVGPSFVMWFPEILNSYSNNMDRVNDLTFCEIIRAPRESIVSNITEVTETCNDKVNDLALIFIVVSGTYSLILTSGLVMVTKLIGKKWTFIGLHVTCGLAGFLLNNFTNVSSIIFFIIMISNVTCMGITTTYAVELFPTYLRAMAVCLTMMVGRTFSFIVINAITPLVTSNCVLLFYGFGIFILSGGIAAWFLPNDKKESYEEDPEKSNEI